MSATSYYAAEESLEPQALARLQRQKLAAMLREILPTNRFYASKFHNIPFDPLHDPLAKLPFTTRAQLEADQRENPLYGTNLTYPVSAYTRLHQTSGTGGRPMRWLDTRDSWDWFQQCWGTIFTAAQVTPHDRVLFPFSFGPFIGFWAAFEGATRLGALAIPAGGLTTSARIRMALDHQATVICCTPTYALRMAEVAREENIDLAASAVRAIIVAGEPGGSIPAVRSQIESAWGARVYDHTGMTEIGALGFECHEAPGGVHLIEHHCIPEVINPDTGEPLPDGSSGELVLTNLGRWGSPLIRYRTGDHVRLTPNRCACGRWYARLEGGILGRLDDMVCIRGNNVFPSAIEALLREHADVAEYQVEVTQRGALADMYLRIEPAPGAEPAAVRDRVTKRIQDALAFRAHVELAPPGSLPRFELKARRFVRKRVESPVGG